MLLLLSTYGKITSYIMHIFHCRTLYSIFDNIVILISFIVLQVFKRLRHSIFLACGILDRFRRSGDDSYSSGHYFWKTEISTASDIVLDTCFINLRWICYLWNIRFTNRESAAIQLQTNCRSRLQYRLSNSFRRLFEMWRELWNKMSRMVDKWCPSAIGCILTYCRSYCVH